MDPVNVPNGWPCSFCGNGNTMSTQVCQKCGKPKVDVNAKPVQEGKVRRTPHSIARSSHSIAGATSPLTFDGTRVSERPLNRLNCPGAVRGPVRL